MDRYSARIKLFGETHRERTLRRQKAYISDKSKKSLSCKSVKINGEEAFLIIDSGTYPHTKQYKTLPEENINVGDYVEFMGRTFIVESADTDSELYTDGTLKLCNYRLFWQNTDGEIISRYAYVHNTSDYYNGESAGIMLVLPKNRYSVLLPYDDETKMLTNGKRIHISKYSGICRPYRLTRSDDVSDFGNGEKSGLISLIFSEDEYRREKDISVICEGENIWICDYTKPQKAPQGDIYIKGSDKIRIGFSEKYIPSSSVSDISWDISCAAEGVISEAASDGTLTLKAEKDILKGEKVRITLLSHSVAICDKVIDITDIWEG